MLRTDQDNQHPQKDLKQWDKIQSLVYDIKQENKSIHHEAFNYQRSQLRSQVPRIKVLLGEQKCPEMSFQTIVQIKKFVINAIKFATFVLQANTFDLEQQALLLQIAVESVQMIIKHADNSYIKKTIKQLENMKLLLNENVQTYLLQAEKQNQRASQIQEKKYTVYLDKSPVHSIIEFDHNLKQPEQDGNMLFSTIQQVNDRDLQQDDLFEDISMLKTHLDNTVQYLSIEQLEKIIGEIKDQISQITRQYMKNNLSCKQQLLQLTEQSFMQITTQDIEQTQIEQDEQFQEMQYQLDKQKKLLEYNLLHLNALKYLQKHSITYDQLMANQISSNLVQFDISCIQDGNFKQIIAQFLNQHFYTLGTNKFDNYFVLFLIKLFGKSFKMVQNENLVMNIMYQLLHNREINDFFIAFVVEQLFNQKIIYEDFTFKQYLHQFKQCFNILNNQNQQYSDEAGQSEL